MSDDLPDRLRSAAAEFEPDRDRMWERVSEGMSRHEPDFTRPLRSGVRIPHLALATVAAVFLVAVVVFIGLRAPTGAEVRPAGPGPSTSALESPETGDGAQGPVIESVDELESVDVEAGLNRDGSIDYWSQAELRLTVSEPVTELTAELWVAMRDDVRETGSWVTADDYFAPAEVHQQDGYLVFRWTLIEGRTIEPGEYTLAGQYNHGDGPRSTEADYFELEATTGSESGRIAGGVAGR